MTLQDLYNQVLTDQAAQTAAQSALASAQAAVDSSATQTTTDQATFATAIAADAPSGFGYADSTNVYIISPSSAAPGYSVVSYPLGSTVSVS